MKVTQRLHDLGQSLWLDNITRGLLTEGTLRRYIDEVFVTGLTSNPTIYDHAIKNTDFYNQPIHKKVREGKSGEQLFFELALEDLTQAADLFRPSHDRTGGVDGWVSLEVSPLLAYDTVNTIPEKTLLAFADHGEVKNIMAADSGDAEEVLAKFARLGVSDSVLATELQREGALSFSKSWNELMDSIALKSNGVG